MNPSELWMKRNGIEEMPKDPKERRELMQRLHRERVEKMREKMRNRA